MKKFDPKRIIKGIGSILPQNKDYDQPSRALEALAGLAENQKALQFVSSDGWKDLMKEYQAQVKDLNDNILYLAQDAVNNREKIQRASDFVKVFEIIIKSTQIIVAQHIHLEEEFNKHKQPAA